VRDDLEPQTLAPVEAPERGTTASPPGCVPGLRMALALVALTVALMGSSPRVGSTVDSGEYLAVAEGLTSGSGYTMPYLSYDELYPTDPAELDERVDLAHFPPAYPTVLAVADVLLPGGLLGTAKWVSAIAFAVTTLALTSLCRRPRTAVLTTLGVLSVDLVTIHSMAWSEPLLLASTAVAVVYAVRYVEGWRRVDLVYVCLAVATASGARFIGTAVGVGIAAGMVAHSAWLRRPALLVAAAGVVPTVLWFARNAILLGEASEREIAWHPPGAENLRQAVESLGAWTVGAEPWGLLLLLPAVAVAVLVFVDGGPLRRSLQSSVRLQIALAGAAVYLAFLLGSRAFVDSNIPMDIRLVAPIHLFLLIALAALIDAVPAATAGDGVRRQRLAVTFAGASLLVGAVGGVDLADELSGQEDSGYAAQRWTDSNGIAFIAALSDDTTVVTNAPDAAWLLAEHERLLFLPVGMALYTGGPNLEYDAQLQALATTLRDRPGAVVVHFDRPTRGRSLDLTQETRDALDLTFLIGLGDATVWDVGGA
jgi:hypothetical protein